MYVIHKFEGETPLEALQRLRVEKSIGAKVPMTYAGRLDPMAEGLLLILVGDECKEKEKYLGLDKEYEVEVLLGFGSDTGDILGIVKRQLAKFDDKQVVNLSSGNISEEKIRESIELLVGKRSEKYPSFSSKTVNGKPLFMYAKDGTLDNIDENEIPSKDIEIYSIDFIGIEHMDSIKLIDTAILRIKKVKGDFRQTEVIKSWDDSKKILADQVSIIKLKIKSSTGAYMRTLAQKLGELLGVEALAWKIKRTKIGNL